MSNRASHAQKQMSFIGGALTWSTVIDADECIHGKYLSVNNCGMLVNRQLKLQSVTSARHMQIDQLVRH